MPSAVCKPTVRNFGKELWLSDLSAASNDRVGEVLPHDRQEAPRDYRRFDEADHLRDMPFELFIAADQLGLRKPVLQIPNKGIGIIAERDRANALLCRGYEDGSRASNSPTAKRIDVPRPPERNADAVMPRRSVAVA